MGVVITFSSHLHDRSSCLIKALMHNTREGIAKEEEREREKKVEAQEMGLYNKLVSW